MQRIDRFLRRLLFYAAKAVVRPLEGVLPRAYMALYLPLLRSMGMCFSGTPRYIASSAHFDDFELITLGERVVISGDVRFLTHDYSATTVAIAMGLQPPTDIYVKRQIVVDDNVFIGMRCLLLPGTRIDRNVIIGAGSVVRGRVAEDSLVVGSPAEKVSTLSELAAKWFPDASRPFDAYRRD